jgi:putative acetyltransferase
MASRRPAVTVRRAEVGDAEAIRRTMAAPRAQAGTLQMPLPTVEMWRKRIADIAADDYLLVAEVKGEVVGNAGLHSAGRARRKHAGAVGMSVRDDWQRRGVGTALLAAVIDIADNWLGYRRLELTVYTDNAAAIALYRKFGFEIEGTLRQYAFRNGEYVDTYTMARLRSEPAVRALRKRKG